MDDTNETQYKQYNNEELYRLIQSKIPENKYGEFTSLVYEIILRRSYTFSLTKEQISTDIDNLLNNCETIQFSDKFSKKSTLGHIVLSKKKLEINSKAYETNTNYEKMFETLTHEIYHAMSAKKTEDNRVYTGLQYFDEKGKKHGSILNEVFNEVAADLASYHRTQKDEDQFYHKTMGYPYITFVVFLLAASIGTTEKELIKFGISSRNELIEFMSSKIPESERQGFIESFEKFEFQLETLKSLTDKLSSDLTEDDKKNIENAYIEISNFSFNTLYASIINDKRPLTKEIQEEFEYRRDAISNIVSNANKVFSIKMLPDANNRISQNVYNESRNRLNSLVLRFNHITRISDQISENELQQLIANIKTNYPQRKYNASMQFEKKLLYGRGITPYDPVKNNLSKVKYPVDVTKNSYRRKIRSENHDDFKQWNNTIVSQKMKQMFESWLIINRTSSEAENIVTPEQIANCGYSEQIALEEEIEDIESFLNTKIHMQNRENKESNDRN